MERSQQEGQLDDFSNYYSCGNPKLMTENCNVQLIHNQPQNFSQTNEAVDLHSHNIYWDFSENIDQDAGAR